MTQVKLLTLAILLAACGTSPAEHLRQARAALADADYVRAAAVASQGLARPSDAQTTWSLELVQLESQARLGKAAEVLAQLRRLQATHAQHLKAERYVAVAEQLRAAGKPAAAVEVLDLGRKQLPDAAAIHAQLERVKGDPGSPETLETLRSLGYVQ